MYKYAFLCWRCNYIIYVDDCNDDNDEYGGGVNRVKYVVSCVSAYIFTRYAIFKNYKEYKRRLGNKK
jgi:hypothetical protein